MLFCECKTNSQSVNAKMCLQICLNRNSFMKTGREKRNKLELICLNCQSWRLRRVIKRSLVQGITKDKPITQLLYLAFESKYFYGILKIDGYEWDIFLRIFSLESCYCPFNHSCVPYTINITIWKSMHHAIKWKKCPIFLNLTFLLKPNTSLQEL